MNKIQLLYVENVISRKNKTAQQKLSFFMRLDNLSYDKYCEVVWSGEDGVWFSLPASYHSALESNQEYWSAEITLTGTSEKSLPGNIIFALRFFAQDQEYWDNNEGLNYSIQADSGIKVVSNQLIQNIGFEILSTILTIPLSASTSTMSPSFNTEVPYFVPTIQGILNSLAITAT